MKYTTLLFDLDETLFDFSKAEKNAAFKLMNLYGIPETEENYRLYSEINQSKWKMLEKGEISRKDLGRERFVDFFKKTGTGDDPAEANLRYMQFLSEGSFMIDGALETCRELSKDYSLYLVTNGSTSVQTGRLKGSPIMNYIKDVFISEEVGFNKPQKEYFDLVLSKISEKNKSKILLIGDSLTSDIAGAENSGIDACWVNRKNMQTEMKPKYIIENVTELLDILNT